MGFLFYIVLQLSVVRIPERMQTGSTQLFLISITKLNEAEFSRMIS